MIQQMKHEVTANIFAPFRSGDGCLERFHKSLSEQQRALRVLSP